jgi:DNA mismatch repair protein MutS2
MQLEDYWGIGPKTATVLREELGEPAAIDAIEAADSRPLVRAGVNRGRVTRILRRAHGGEGMDLLATRDARQVYRDLIELIERYAVTAHAGDRIRCLTPLTSPAIEERLDETMAAVNSWDSLDSQARETVLDAFETYDSHAGEATAVETALALSTLDLTEKTDEDGTGGDGSQERMFAPLTALDQGALSDAVHALRALDTSGGIAEGADDTVDQLRADLGAVEDMAAGTDVLETVKTDARDASTFRDSLVRHLTNETALDTPTIRDAMPTESADASAFVTETLRTLTIDLRERAEEEETRVREQLEATIEDAREDVDRAISVVDDIAFQVSLARFALAFDLRRPVLLDGNAIAVQNARNLTLFAADETETQPVTYALGTHDLTLDVPVTDDDERVAVLTGANSGGKTTLLETLCQVALLAHMGLPVPVEAAAVSRVDSLVFHRRHASFNAGVLESTLQSVVPPLTETGRTLMLVDEFEAITEPGSAADLLHGLVTLTVDREALGVFVTHLAEDLEPLPESARVDGIFAEGLTSDLELEVDYQPRFDTLGQSTPEFIVSRLVAQAGDTNEQQGFETLAQSVGQDAVQQTLSDAQWAEEGISSHD